MGISIKATATNNADWNMQIQVNDADTDALVDFTGASIVVQVKDQNKCVVLDGSTANGKVTLPSTGVIEWLFPESEMDGLCVGSYKVGGVYELNDEVVSLFTGDLTIVDGIASI